MSMQLIPDKFSLSKAIKQKALELGFTACGITSSYPPEGMMEKYLLWIKRGYHGEMTYLENHIDKRMDPSLLVEGTKSIICLAMNYYPSSILQSDQLQFAYYAYGKDYHDVVKARLNALLHYINDELHPVKGRVFCDTAPVLERYWASQAGIGWIGKNNLLIIPGAGSFFFLGEMMVDIELAYDEPLESRCGNCKACVDACPTTALEQPYVLNSTKCLSYLTIENRDEIPEHYVSGMRSYIYGCDICQKVCPWNRFASSTSIEEFQPSPLFLDMKRQDWKNLSKEEFRKIFKGSAVKRAKYIGLMRNIKAVVKE